MTTASKNTSTDAEAAKFYRRWQKYIVQQWQPEIPAAAPHAQARPGARNHREGRRSEGPTRTSATDLATLKLVAVAIAMHGNYGRNCFPSDVTVGRQIARSRWTVRRYRELLLDFGAFTDAGPHGRTRALDISTPVSKLPRAVPAAPLVSVPAPAPVPCTCNGLWPGEPDWCEPCQSRGTHSLCPAGCRAADSVPLAS